MVYCLQFRYCNDLISIYSADSIWRSFACAQLTTTEIDLIPEMSNWKARYQQLYYAPKQIQYTIRDLNNERKFKRILYNSVKINEFRFLTF